jgi:hypothetical protein
MSPAIPFPAVATFGKYARLGLVFEVTLGTVHPECRIPRSLLD